MPGSLPCLRAARPACRRLRKSDLRYLPVLEVKFVSLTLGAPEAAHGNDSARLAGT